MFNTNDNEEAPDASNEPTTTGMLAVIDDQIEGVALALAYLGEADLLRGEFDIRAALEGLIAAFDQASASAKVRQNDPTDLENSIDNAVRDLNRRVSLIHELSDLLFRCPDAEALYSARVDLLDSLKRACLLRWIKNADLPKRAAPTKGPLFACPPLWIIVSQCFNPLRNASVIALLCRSS